MPKKILVVDDEENVVMVVEARLKGNGFAVVTAFDGETGLKKAKAENPDLVILDLMMPGMNGFQVCQALKNHSKCKHIPVILLTARSTESDQFWGMQAGADAYLTKPYHAEDLIAKVRELVG